MDKNTLIIGLTGSFGSGCTETAEYLAQKGFLKFSLSDIIRNEAKTRKLHSLSRKDKQNIGDNLREKKGHGYLMIEALNTLKKINKTSKPVVIDSIKNHKEVYELRQNYFKTYLVNIDAEKDIRYKRVESKYSSKEEFEEDDERESGEDQPEYGQQVKKCVDLADIVVNNNTSLQDLHEKLEKYLRLIKNPKQYRPSKDEKGMTYAFRESGRSRCLKRKVGAAIMKNIEGRTALIACGFNDVPVGVVPCGDMGKCMRDFYRDQKCSTCGEPIILMFHKCSKCGTTIPKDWGKMIRKHLDLCRALHAEEMAILNCTKKKVSLKGATLYVTTYPCLLCAKKIIEVGIKEVVYVDPYPYEEAVKMLSQVHVRTTKFEGVKEQAFHRLYKTNGR